MIKIYKRHIFLILVLLGAFLRILWLDRYPSGFFRDEAALGYNAYSIWQTARDEYGKAFPIVFRSFEVFFLPAYIYLSAPIVGILGLTEFSTRLLSSLSGVTLLIIGYFLAKELWDRKVAILALLFLAISPWHIFYSRGAFEGNLGLTFFTLGFLFLLKFLKNDRSLFFLTSSIFFALSMYSYQSERLTVPLLVFSILVINFRKAVGAVKKLWPPLFIVFLFLSPLIFLTLKPGGYHRAAGVSIFMQENPPGYIEGKADGFIVNNKLFLTSRQILSLYLSYYSPKNLFYQGDANRQRSTQNYSVFYIWMTPLLLVGFYEFLKNKKDYFQKTFLSWVLFAPIPAALTGDPFHTYRSLLLYLPLTIIIALGFSKIRDYFGKDLSRNIFTLVVIIVAFADLSLFVFDYLFLTPVARARDWDWGYKQVVEYVSSVKSDKIVIDDSATEGYIHFLFFSKVNPKVYQKAVSNLEKSQDYYYNDADLFRPEKIGKWEFRKVDWPLERGDKNSVFVFWSLDLPESEFRGDPNVELLKEIKYPDGTVAYRIIKIK